MDLSRASLENWVAKTAGLLEDVDVAAGDALTLVPARHWTSVVVLLAGLRVGATVHVVAAGSDPGTVGAGGVVAAPVPDAPALLAAGADTVLALRDPLDRASAPQPAAGLVDLALEASGFPDTWPPGGGGTLDIGGRRLSDDDLGRLAAELPEGTRVLSALDPATPEGLVDAVLAPLGAGGCVLWDRPEPPDEAAATERATDVRA